MESHVTLEEQKIHPALESFQAWQEALLIVQARYSRTLDVLGDKGQTQIIVDIMKAQNIDSTTLLAFGNRMGRLAHCLPIIRNSASIDLEPTYWEVMQSKNLFKAYPEAVEAILHLIGFHMARQADTNVAGAGVESNVAPVLKAGLQYKGQGNKEMLEEIINPFHLKEGTAIYYFDKKSKSIKSHPLEIVIDTETGKGLVLFQDEEINLDKFNLFLAQGIYMLNDGSNFFGGISYLENGRGIDQIKVGETINVDYATPFDKEPNIQQIKCVGSNLEEVRLQYGDAFIPFFNLYPRDTPLVTINFELSDGKVVRNFDFRFLKIIIS